MLRSCCLSEQLKGTMKCGFVSAIGLSGRNKFGSTFVPSVNSTALFHRRLSKCTMRIRIITMCKQHESGSSSKISRRQAMQLLNAVLGAVTVTLLVRMKEQFRLLSPQAMISVLGLGRNPKRAAIPPAIAAGNEQSARFEEAIKYVEKIDKRSPVSCPDFPKFSDWINSRPLSLKKELKGKVVLLDFFTYCCINCQHVLPKLKEIEQRYGEDGSGGVVVVGVHSAKFTAERETKNIAAAVERYNVVHPVVNDEKMELWNTIGISSWPTLALVGPKGNFLAVWSGERQEQDIDTVIAASLEYYSDVIDHRPLPKAPRNPIASQYALNSPLRYPGKLSVSPDGSNLYISDSGNNRVIEVDSKSGKTLRIFGNGEAGLKDASNPSEAMFHSPQGLAMFKNTLFVADTEAHAVRTINLSTGSVGTIGGTGEQGFDYAGGQIGTKQMMSSPWDVEVSDNTLYVAMAGTHQLWSLQLPADNSDKYLAAKWEVFSGSGRELEKNSSQGRAAAWAQPSHLSAGDNGLMYVADSESSSVRSIDLEGSHPTTTLAGGDGLIAENLFSYGDIEGKGARAKFQHPLAVCYDNQRQLIYVADSYNHRIKVVTESGVSSVLCGGGTPGYADGTEKKALFWEPAGLAISPDASTLYVADTNNAAIRSIDLANKNVSTLNISKAPITTGDTSNFVPLIRNRRRAVKIPSENIASDSDILVTIKLPDKSHFTPGTTSRFQANLRNDGPQNGQEQSVVLASGIITQQRTAGTFSIDLSKYRSRIELEKNLEIETVTYYCTEEDDVCRTEADVFEVSLTPNSSKSAVLEHQIKRRQAPSSLPV